ncbi:MAG TPA: EAL domain-containing protein [Paraburkholderia sp.]|jgi:EAL domain-containing protein (putative c-di-GMP-specific phosphodiesterase class I)|nr:EAL domain-containing protein [Paraburkholderia sp.]
MPISEAALPTDLLQSLERHADGWIARWRGYTLESAFQPVLSITHQRIVGYEALLRAADLKGNNVGPADLFARIPPADATPLDLLARCLHMANFADQHIETGWLFLNTLPRMADGQFTDRKLIEALCEHFGLPLERIVIEVLEQRAVDERASFMESRPAYGSRPFLLALDDFGAGFSNFDRVWRYRPDIVKLDRSLVKRATDQQTPADFLPNLVSILHHAGTMVLAEGVETEQEMMLLMQADVDLVQGFCFGQPLGSIRQASDGAPALMQSMWQHFASFVREADQREQVNVGALTSAMLDGAMLLAHGGPLAEVAHALFERTNALRVFATDAHGVQHAPSIPNPLGAAPRPLAPLFPDDHCNWSRRDYFRSAIAAPGRVSVKGPHYSITDGRLCFTASIAIEAPGGMTVLCADFPFRSASDPAPPAA